MKNPKKPTREQRKVIAAAGLDAAEWKVVKILGNELELVNIHTLKTVRVSAGRR